MQKPNTEQPNMEPLVPGDSTFSRSAFLARLALGVGAAFGGSGAVLDFFSSLPALAAGVPKLSITSTMPIVSKVGLFLGNVKSLQPNKALAYSDPKTGDPALVIRLANGHLVSYDVVCPHRGCGVTYDPTRQKLVCPCHGAQFDPARQAAPVGGPVSQPLITLPVRVDSAGNLYALDAKPGSRVNRLHAPPPPSSEDGGGGDDGGSHSRRRKKRGGDN